MSLARPASAAPPRHFGRGPRKEWERIEPAGTRLGADLKLFATTFAAGFIFVWVLLA